MIYARINPWGVTQAKCQEPCFLKKNSIKTICQKIALMLKNKIKMNMNFVMFIPKHPDIEAYNQNLDYFSIESSEHF